MKTFRIIPILLLIFCSGAVLDAGESQTETLHLLFTNDLLGGIAPVPASFMNPENPPMLSGGAGMYNYVQSVREKARANDESTLLLDGGDFFSGTVLGTYDRGATMITWMNWMGYDAAAIGPMDFDFGVKNLERLAGQSKFPFLSANMMKIATQDPVRFTRNYLLRDVGDVTIGIIGLTNSDVHATVLPDRLTGVTIQHPLKVARQMVQEVRDQGADVVIALSSLGLPYDRREEYETFIRKLEHKNINWENQPLNALELAHLAPGIDIILTGGNTAGYNTPWEDPATHTLVVQNYGNGSGLAHLILQIDSKTKTIQTYDTPLDRGMSVTLLENDIWPDLTMQDSIKVWTAQAQKSLDREYTSEVVAMLAEPQNGKCLTPPDYRTTLDYDWDVPAVNDTHSIEIITWNIEQFPHAGDTTIQAVASVLRDLQPDMVAVQEIGHLGEFARLMELLPEYSFVISQHSSFYDQGIIYRKDVISLLGQREYFTLNDFYFAGRPPFQADFLYQCGNTSMEFSVVNLHLKCCGDGLYRRQRSMEQLHRNLRQQMMQGHGNYIVLGDWNDELLNTGIYQSFYPFLEDTAHFTFATMEIVKDPAQASYPSWPSFLDHILYSQGLFDEAKHGGHVQTLRIDDYMNGWKNYETMISDHRPVLWSFPVQK